MTEDDNEDGIRDTIGTIASSGVLVSASRFFGLFLAFLTQVVMARFLSSDAYGEVVLVIAVIGTAGVLTKLGLDDGVVRQYPEYEESPEKAHGVVRAALVMAAVSGIIAAVLVYVFAPVIGSLVFNDQSLIGLLRIAAIALPFVTVRTVSVALARGARDARTHAYVDHIAQPISRLSLIGGLVLGGFGAFGAIVGQTVALVVAGLLALYISLRVLPRFDGTPEPMYRTVLSFSIPLVLVHGMGNIVRQIDVYTIGYFLTSSAVGEYNVVLQLSNLFYPVLHSIGFLLPPILTKLSEQGKQEQSQQIYQFVTKWVAFISYPLLMIFLLIPERVVGLSFGQSYVPGATALQILAIGNFVSISAGLIDKSLISLGDNRLVSYIVLYRTVSNAILAFLLVPIIGIEGAAVSTMFALVSTNIIGGSILHRRYDINPVNLITYKSISVISIISLAIYSISITYNISSLVTLMCILLIYPIVITRFGIQPEDGEVLRLIEDRTGTDLATVRQAIQTIK